MAIEVIHAIRTQEGWDSMTPEEQARYAGYYTNLDDWNEDQQRDLVSVDEVAIAEVFNDWPSGLPTSVSIGLGWTTDASLGNIVIVRSAEGHTHDGTPNSGAKLVSDATYVFSAGVDVDIIGLELTGNSVLINLQYVGSGKVVNIERNLLHTSNNKGIKFAASGAINVLSNIFIGVYRAIYSTSTHTNLIAENNTAINCGDYGFLRAVFINCVAIGHTSRDYFGAAAGSDFNASSDGTAPGATVITGITDVEFVDPVNDDYHLDPASQLIGAGDNRYDGSDTQTDIDGDLWPAAGAWDIGADYYTSGVTPPTTKRHPLFNFFSGV